MIVNRTSQTCSQCQPSTKTTELVALHVLKISVLYGNALSGFILGMYHDGNEIDIVGFGDGMNCLSYLTRY